MVRRGSDHVAVCRDKLAARIPGLPAERNVMKHSLTAPLGPVPALFDLLAAGLAGGAPGRVAGAARKAPARPLLERIEHALWRARQRQVERYLASSVDLADLETRLKDLERRPYHLNG